MKNKARYQFISTKERELFAQYVNLRRRVYLNAYPWLPADFGGEDETDHDSAIVVYVEGGVVGAGARLTTSTPACPRDLPMEETGFRLRDCPLLADLDLAEGYGEISRMAADPAYAHGFEISTGLGDLLCGRAAAGNLNVVFSICPEKPARLNAMNAKRRGVGFRRNSQIGTAFGKDMWLCAFSGLLNVYTKHHLEAA